MKVSIITVTYNSVATLQDCISSIAAQTYPDIEHIIVDGNSTDGTMKIVQSSQSVAKHVSEEDNGLYDAMNKGIGLASGDLIGILNSDDIFADFRVIEDVVGQMKNKDALYSDLCYVDENDLEKVTRYWKSGGYNRNSFKRGWMPPHPTLFVRKELYQKYGLFNTNLVSAADYELMLRFLYKNSCSVAYLPRVTVKMREGGLSNQSLANRMRANKEDKKSWELNNLKMPALLPILKPLRKVHQFFTKP